MNHLKALLGFFVLLTGSTPALAEVPTKDIYPKCVNEVYDGAPDDEVAKDVENSERPLYDTGAKLITDFICRGREACLSKNGPRFTKAAHTVLDVCLEDKDIPKYICLGIVANLSNEGGGTEHPSCGGLAKDCVLRCDQIWVNSARNDCFKQCAIEQGLPRGGARWARVLKCNDKGSSRGPFQMKKGRIAQCKRLLGDSFDPFNLAQAARCQSRIIKRTALSKRWACGKVNNRWLVAFTRATRGVIRTVAKAQPGRYVPTTRGGSVWVGPSKKVVEQICEESGYGKLGLRYYRACGKKCFTARRPTPAQKNRPAKIKRNPVKISQEID